MLLQNHESGTSNSLVKIQSSVSALSVGNGGERRKKTRGLQEEKKKKIRNLIEMGSILILENVSLTDCPSPLPQGFDQINDAADKLH